jgi:tape measure domain-containing protein
MANSAARVGSINVLLQVQFGQATAGLNNFAGTVESTGVRTQRSVAGIDRTISGLNRTVGSLNGRGFNVLAIGALRAKESLDQMRGLLLATSALFGGLVPAALGASLVRVADRAHLLSNNLKTVTKDADDLKATQEALFAVSQRTRSGFESTATIYARTARATEGLNVSQSKLLRLTETIQKSFAVGGATTAEAQGAAIQLSQGIASNRFSGDEFRSVAENAPVLLKGMADSMGVTIGRLREMAHSGKLTADVVVKAIIDASQRIDEEFAKTTSTIGQAFVQVDNALLKYVGDSDKATVASNAIVTVLQALASNIDTVATALTLLGAAFGAKLASSGANRFTGMVKDMRAARIEALATAAAMQKVTRAEALTAAQSASAARRNVIGLARGRDDELGTMRAQMLKANADKAIAAEQAVAETAKKAGEVRAAADMKAAAAKVDASAKWSAFMSVARQEKKVAVDNARAALQEAAAQQAATQTRLAGARSYYEMAKSSTVSQKTQVKAGKDLQAALQADLRASQSVVAAQANLQAALDGTATKSRAYLSAQRAMEAAKNQAAATSVAAAAAEMKHTEALAAHAAAQKATQAAIASGNLTKEQEAALNKRAEVLERKVAAAKAQSTAATLAARDANRAAATATLQLADAQAAATVRGTAFAAAGRAVSAVWTFIGGPIGAAILGASVVMALMSKSSADAQEAASDYAEAIQKAGEESGGAAGGIRRASEELTRAAQAANNAGAAARNLSLAKAQGQFDDSIEKMRILASSMRGVIDIAIGFNSMNFSPVASEVDGLVTRFQKGEISAEELRAALDRIAAANPDNSAILARIQEIGDIADGARGRVDALNDSLLALQKSAFAAMEAAAGLKNGGVGEKGDKPEHILTSDEFNNRFGGRYAKSNKELFPSLYKPAKRGRGSRAPRKTADDRFDNDVQGIRDRITAMKEEQSALGATYQEQQRRKTALDLEQTALKQVREEARKKGDQDWQNAQLSPEQTKRIDEVSAAYAQQAETLRQATEDFELRKDILSGGFTDLRNALEDGKITSQEWADILINALDKVIDKIQGDLVDALAKLWQANSGGTGGGGILGSIGSLFGLGGGFSSWDYATADLGVGLFDSGGTHLGSNIIPFGPKTKTFGPGILADSGFGVRHFPAVLEKGESVLTENMMGRTVDVISGLASRIPSTRTASQEVTVRGVFVDDNGVIKARIEQTSSAAVRNGLDGFNRDLPARVQEIQADPRGR